jgi:hypothetical protein
MNEWEHPPGKEKTAPCFKASQRLLHNCSFATASRVYFLKRAARCPPGRLAPKRPCSGVWRLLVEEKEHWDSSDEKAKELSLSMFGKPDEVREMAQMPRRAHSYAEVRAILEGMVDKPIISKSGLPAALSKKSIKKILGGEAVGKSFNLKVHLKAAANLDKLFTNAIERWMFVLDPNKNNDSLNDRKYLYAPMESDGRIVPVKFTVKEYKDIKTEKRLYSIAVIDAEIK